MVAIVIATAAAAAVAQAASAGAATPVTSGPNLIVNGGAESGMAAGSGYDTVTIPGWNIAGMPTVVRYGQHTDGVIGTAGTPRGLAVAGTFPTAATPGPSSRGRQLFVGGQDGSDTLVQTVSLAGAARAIARGHVRFTLGGWLGGNLVNGSTTRVTVTFRSAGGRSLASSTIGPVTVLDRTSLTALLERELTGTVPAAARSARVTLTMTDATPPNQYLANSYNDAYADNLSLRISARLLAPPAPVSPPSRVGRLDHVFMVFMENEGFTDIVGNSAAPYLNSLIRRNGLATDYHGVEHPSDDNYVAFFGGSTYGIDANCAPRCPVKQRNLADEVEAAHKSWRFYEETMPSPCYLSSAGPVGPGGPYYTPDLLPWSYFSDLLGNPTRCHAHDFPLGQLSTDLASARTTPNYVWFEANDFDDMEQGGVAAGDRWLRGVVGQIMRSPAFTKQRSAIFVTWDEDFNNKTFNQDNQDNRVPTIVIPSPRSGMLTGPVRDGAYMNHYSLLRTLETALGLPRLTLNDRFALPLNGFWPAVPVLSGLRIADHRGIVSLTYRDSVRSTTVLTLTRRGRTITRIVSHDRAGANTARLGRALSRRLGSPATLTLTAANAAGVTGTPLSARVSIGTNVNGLG